MNLDLNEINKSTSFRVKRNPKKKVTLAPWQMPNQILNSSPNQDAPAENFPNDDEFNELKKRLERLKKNREKKSRVAQEKAFKQWYKSLSEEKKIELIQPHRCFPIDSEMYKILMKSRYNELCSQYFMDTVRKMFK
jgi:hypothetical protein